MRRSTLPARLTTSAIALILTPIALVLLSMGGVTTHRMYLEFGFDGDVARLLGPLLVQALGVALLVVVVLTGIWSSAGLIVVGAFSIAPLIVAILPVTLSGIYRVAPRAWGDGLLYGVPLVILAALGGMGLVLALVRRDPRPKGGALGTVGIIVVPLLLAAGAWAIAWGIAEGSLFALQRFQFDIRPTAAIAVVAGTLLVLAGIALTRWSPFALILPATVLLVSSALLIIAPEAVSRVFFALPRGVNTVIPSLMLYGGGASAAVAYLTFTVVLLRVRATARLTAGRTAPDAASPDAAYPPVPPQQYDPYPPQQYDPYPPQQYQQQYPPAPQQDNPQPPPHRYPPQPGQ